MARDLKLQVILDAIDRATGPLKRIQRGSTGTAEALRASRDQLKSLEAAQRDLRGFANLKRTSEGTAQSLNQQQQQIRELTRQIENTEGPTRRLIQQRNAAIRQAQRLKTQYRQEQQQLQTLRGKIHQVHGITGNLSSRQAQLTEKIRAANHQLQTQQQRLTRVAERQKRAAEAAERYQRAMGLTGRMAGAGAGMLGAGIAKGYAATRVLAPGVAWAEQMATLQAVGRFDANDPRFQALRAQSRDLGATTAFSANEVGAGQEFLLRAGLSADAIRASMRDVLDLALANNTELARTADIASNIAGAFKINMEAEGAMARVADVLSGTASRANVNLEMLGETMKYLGGAEDLDLTLEQAAAMAGMLGNIGIQGSQAGTTMRALMNRLTNPVGKAQAAIESLSLQVADADGNMRSLPDILRDINQATAKLGNVERKSILQQIFGAEAGSGTAELISQMSTGALDDLINALGDNAGENRRMANTMADNIAGDLKGLRSAWEEVGISISDTNDGPLRSLIQSVTGVLRGLGQWIKENPVLVSWLSKIAGVLIVLTTVGGALTLMLASLIGPFAMLRYGLAMVGIQSTGLAKIFAVLLGALKKLALFMLTNPIGLAITALALAAYLLWRNWDGVVGGLKALWQEMGGSFGAVLATIGKAIVNWSPLGLFYKAFAGVLNWFGAELPHTFTGFGAMLITGLTNGILGALGTVKDTLLGAGDAVIGWFKGSLGINSPSRVFAGFGENTMQGYEQGILKARQGPVRQVADTARRISRAGAGIALGSAMAFNAAALDTRGPLQAAAGHITVEGDAITLNVYPAPGMDEQALAAHIERILDAREHRKAARIRSALHDID